MDNGQLTVVDEISTGIITTIENCIKFKRDNYYDTAATKVNIK